MDPAGGTCYVDLVGCAGGTGQFLLYVFLTHWSRVTHICVSKLSSINSYNSLSPDRRQPIIWINAGILLIGPLGTNFNEILIEIQPFSFNKIHLKMSGKWRPFCLGLIVLKAKYAPANAVSFLVLGLKSLNSMTNGLIIRKWPQANGMFSIKFPLSNSQGYPTGTSHLNFPDYRPANITFYFYSEKNNSVLHFMYFMTWRRYNVAYCTVNIVASDGLVTQGARASAAMVLT